MDVSLQLSTAAELAAYHQALADTHRPRWRWDVLRMADGAPLYQLPAPEDGVITADRGSDVTRGVTGTSLDADHLAQVDTSSPSDGTLTLDRILQIKHTIFVPKLGRDVTTTPFYGWLTKADRDGDSIVLEGQGLERRAMFGCEPLTVSTGTKITDAIKRILSLRYGETRFRFPSNIAARLLAPVTVSWNDDHAGWPICQKLAHGIDQDLFYSLDGWCTLRTEPTAAVVDLVIGGPSANVTTPPKFTVDALATINRVEGRGKGYLKFSAVADAASANSRTNLARNGVPFDMPLLLENDAYTTQTLVVRASTRSLTAGQKQTQDGSYDVVPLPHLDVGDMANLVTPDYVALQRLQGFQIPTFGPDMTVNRRTNLNPNRKAIRA